MGIGTGINLQHYGPRVTELVGVDWSDNMRMKAFGKQDDNKQDPDHQGPGKVKLVRGDCLSLDQFKDESFDCVVDTLTLHSCSDRELFANEIKRLVRPGGYILLMERGQSYISLYNQWLQFKAAQELMEKGTVEHLDIESVVQEHFKGLKVIHKERKNMGMTYVYIIENSPEEEEETEKSDE